MSLSVSSVDMDGERGADDVVGGSGETSHGVCALHLGQGPVPGMSRSAADNIFQLTWTRRIESVVL